MCTPDIPQKNAPANPNNVLVPLLWLNRLTRITCGTPKRKCAHTQLLRTMPPRLRTLCSIPLLPDRFTRIAGASPAGIAPPTPQAHLRREDQLHACRAAAPAGCRTLLLLDTPGEDSCASLSKALGCNEFRRAEQCGAFQKTNIVKRRGGNNLRLMNGSIQCPSCISIFRSKLCDWS